MPSTRHADPGRRRLLRLVVALVALALALPATPAAAEPARRFPDVVVVTVDTLRFDRLSLYGYHRPLTPNVDALLRRGARFDETRVVEPLTGPSLVSMLTSLHPHAHAASRNGLRMRPGLPSLSRILASRGYATAAFVGNWTLRDELTGLAEHFDDYTEVVSRKRWFLFLSEATGAELTDEAVDWVDEHLARDQRWPFFLWVHYVEPHAPYRFHEDLAGRLGITGEPSMEDRYDTEIAYVDREVGRLLAALRGRVRDEDLLVVFSSDHGESLGEHGYWGHGRNLYEPNLRVPLGIVAPGRLRPQAVARPASNLDVAPTLLGVLGLPVPHHFRGYDWSPVLRGEVAAPAERTTWHQAHKGAVQAQSRSRAARRRGLLEVGRYDGVRKEIVDLKDGSHRAYDLRADPDEDRNLVAPGNHPAGKMAEWLEEVQRGLAASDELPPPSLSDEDLEQLRALGYID